MERPDEVILCETAQSDFVLSGMLRIFQFGDRARFSRPQLTLHHRRRRGVYRKRLKCHQHNPDTKTSSFAAGLANMRPRTRSNKSTPSPTRGIATRVQSTRIMTKPSRWHSDWPRNKGARCGTRKILGAEE